MKRGEIAGINIIEKALAELRDLGLGARDTRKNGKGSELAVLCNKLKHNLDIDFQEMAKQLKASIARLELYPGKEILVKQELQAALFIIYLTQGIALGCCSLEAFGLRMRILQVSLKGGE